MWLFDKYQVYEDMNYMMDCINDWAKKMCQLLTIVIENEHRIKELEKEIKKLKEGWLNDLGRTKRRS